MSKDNLLGQRFGRLVVFEESSKRDIVRKVYWFCQCDCGNIVQVIGASLKHGVTKSCGCYRRERLLGANRNLKHGDAMGGKKTALYYTWTSMKDRCYGINNDKYSRYGARGIIVCSEWQESYLNFKHWALSNGYQDSLTIDRINNDGNYEPSNCRWITRSENSIKGSK